MATSSKRRRTSATKQDDTGKTRTISVGRKETLPRKSNASVARRKPVVQPPADVATDKTVTAHAKKVRGAGRSSRKPKPAALEVEIEVDASSIVEEATIVEPPVAPPVLASAQYHETRPHEKRPFMTVVARLVSVLSRWLGVRL